MDSSDEYHTDEKNKRYVTIPLLQEYVSAVVLGPECMKSEAEIRGLLNKTGYKRAGVTKSRLAM
jgi:hypothetical protein